MSQFIGKYVFYILTLSLAWSVAASITASVSASANTSWDPGSVIYGDDNRTDLYQVSDPRILRLANSTVALMNQEHLIRDPIRRDYLIMSSHFGLSNFLCKDEPYYDQHSAAFCSGSLVGKDLVLTAGHCIEDMAGCRNTRFVFNFGIKQAGSKPERAAENDVYSCRQIIGRALTHSGSDWALVRLDRPVVGHTPVALNRTGEIAPGTQVMVIGHPSGLPTKITGGAKVRSVDLLGGYFVTNLDTYGGNSGSAVFNASTGLIEGVLVRGENDFVDTGTCIRSHRCSEDSCRGEDVTRISELAHLIP